MEEVHEKRGRYSYSSGTVGQFLHTGQDETDTYRWVTSGLDGRSIYLTSNFL